MNKLCFIVKLSLSVTIWLAMSLVHARIPVWSFTPLTPTTITLSAQDTTTVQYTLTNQSTKQHSLVMRSIPGVTQVSSAGNCPNPTVLGGHQSCILNLTISGSALVNDVIGGPILCEQGNPNQCYQPSLANSLKITRKSADYYTVGGSVNGLTGTLILENNGGDPQTINADGAFTFSTALPLGSAYSVAVQSQPTAQICTVSNGNGTINNADVTNVMVHCSTNSYTVGGTVSGLASSESVVLKNNGGDDLTRGVNGAFTFPTEVAEGATYQVTVFTQPSTQTCIVTNGSGTMGGANVTNVGVNCTYNPTTLTSSLPSGTDLALSVTGITEYGVPGNPASGVSRVITITNSGPYDAVDFSVTYSGLPAGTTHTGSTCDNLTTLAQGSSCTIQINPGNSPTSSNSTSYISCSNGSEPIAGIAQVNASNASSILNNIVVLGYGCDYKGGFVFALDDTQGCPSSICTGSLGGKVITTSDQINPPASGGIIWSSNGSPGTVSANVSYDLLPGIDETSTSSLGSPTYSDFSAFLASTYTNPNPFTSASFSLCEGLSDGKCNTTNIVTYYNEWITNNTEGNGGSPLFTATSGPTSPTYYAAGVCKQTIGSYSDWYLPAACEMVYFNPSTGLGLPACGTSTIPSFQNVQSSIREIAGIPAPPGPGPNGQYWSSTEDLAEGAQQWAWSAYIDTTQNIQGQYPDFKNVRYGVRCARLF